tara:strand:- start:1591 stop:1785 length:195 start_codon:yes stop_codon:yes gene_type:complete
VCPKKNKKLEINQKNKKILTGIQAKKPSTGQPGNLNTFIGYRKLKIVSHRVFAKNFVGSGQGLP